MSFVLARHPEYAELHVFAANICGALADSPQSGFAEKGRQYLREAVQRGKDKEALRRVLPLLGEQFGKEECQRLLDSLPSAEKNKEIPAPLSLRFENPIEGWLE